MIKYRVIARRCEVTPAAQHAIDRELMRLDPLLRHFDPDLVHLELVVEHHARREEFLGSIRLSVFNQILPAKRNTGPTLDTLLRRAFDDLEEQLSRLKSKLRRDYAHERKRLSLRPEAVRVLEREMQEERELLDQALAGDRRAFETLVRTEVPGLSAAIGRALAERGRQPTREALEHVLADVTTIAFREFPRKPARWSLGGWLAWLARRELARESQGLAVAQSAEQPAS